MVGVAGGAEKAMLQAERCCTQISVAGGVALQAEQRSRWNGDAGGVVLQEEQR